MSPNRLAVAASVYSRLQRPFTRGHNVRLLAVTTSVYSRLQRPFTRGYNVRVRAVAAPVYPRAQRPERVTAIAHVGSIIDGTRAHRNPRVHAATQTVTPGLPPPPPWSSDIALQSHPQWIGVDSARFVGTPTFGSQTPPPPSPPSIHFPLGGGSGRHPPPVPHPRGPLLRPSRPRPRIEPPPPAGP